jgi:holo-[acyl-carrier protein] synthase
MKLATGVDILEIGRLREVIERHGDRFLQRVYTPRELAQVGNNIASLAARFAAKEAVSKALGTGLGSVSFQHVEVLRDEARAPVLYLHGEARQRADLLGLQVWSVSLSHTDEYAVAFVTAIGK